ncbi:MAG TPA: preprotein translocase subunit SecG [Chitinophagaceae bacterium]|jgi:preprotein translocase subunit SecG|nr:preprotein translocase subunit SecG [Chitinophagaceae bacterium]
MMILFLILVILASVVISFFILVQNPKGGGLSGSIAGFNTQFMGVKQTTDVLEKGTWLLAAVIGLLCLLSSLFITKESTIETRGTNAKPAATAPANQPAPPPANTIPMPKN